MSQQVAACRLGIIFSAGERIVFLITASESNYPFNQGYLFPSVGRMIVFADTLSTPALFFVLYLFSRTELAPKVPNNPTTVKICSW